MTNLPVPLAFTPFLEPLPVWGGWYLLILPLCVGVAVVYKSIKCSTMRRVPVEATILTVWILAFFAGLAAALAGLVAWMQR